MCDYYQLSEQGLTGFGGFTRSGIYGDDKIPEHLVPAVVEAFRASTGVTLLVTRIPHLKGEPFCLFYPKEMPEPQRANWRMVMRGILMGLPVLPPKPPIRAIKGTMHSDDYVFECEFDATSWFEQASPEEIVELANCDWGGDLPADRVAQHVEDIDPDVAACLDYCRRKDGVGFEVYVDEEAALQWVNENQPEIIRITTTGDRV